MEHRQQGRKQYGRLLYVSLAALGIWLAVTAGGLTWLDPDTAVLGWVLLALTTTLAVTNLFRYAGWVAASISSILYAALQIAPWGPTDSALVNTVVGFVGLMGTAFLGSTIARQVSAGDRQLEQAQRLIDELTVHDPRTRLIKWQYARHTLKSEIARSRRYHTDLSLLLIRVANWDELVEEHGFAGANALMARVSRIVVDTLRTMDSPTSLDSVTMGAILPETSAEGAQMAAQRLVDAAAREVRVALNIGIAHFPNDAVTDGELLRAARMALQLTLMSDQSIARYDQLYSIAGTRKEDAVRGPRTEPGRGRAELQEQVKTEDNHDSVGQEPNVVELESGGNERSRRKPIGAGK
jgi:diguanylate cyclase (GGDEF)-like protein